MSQTVLNVLYSASVLSMYIDVVLTLSIDCKRNLFDLRRQKINPVSTNYTLIVDRYQMISMAWLLFLPTERLSKRHVTNHCREFVTLRPDGLFWAYLQSDIRLIQTLLLCHSPQQLSNDRENNLIACITQFSTHIVLIFSLSCWLIT